MKKAILELIFSGLWLAGIAQPGQDTTWKKLYRESYPKINDLVHTELNAKFDFSKEYMYGEARITLTPHFYPTDSLDLDAKQMEINAVTIIKGQAVQPVKYSYDGWHLKIKLDRVYAFGEKYIVSIKYIAKPGEAKVSDGAKGLYFINSKGIQKDTPVEIWTDGETEHTSMWCPTIDAPNQKTTEDITMTVPDKYVTLSNGKLISQKKNTDGTRSDHWEMELPHAPYLFFMGVGDFAIVKDQYKGKEVNYYVEKSYASTARRIFGLTPAMIAFFEKITGVPFPWVKYSQIVLRNFTSTAMENTTATAHGEPAQQDARQLKDGNRWESNIAHELFHQWFGDYVTCESWSNLTLNESFANYSQYLWKEHKYGADEAREESYNAMTDYLRNRGDEKKDLVRFYYEDQENLFDGISYQKGGLILNMLRNYIGDSAFFTSLHLYLTTNKFKSTEVHDLRLAFEQVTGQDLNWFFNQWYFGSGHPKVTINYAYDDKAKKETVTIAQTQGTTHLFKIPLSIDVYHGANKVSHNVWISNEKETFVFDVVSKPDLVNVDADKIILWDKADNKSFENFIHQYSYAGNYADRREAIIACAKQQANPLALDLLKKGLTDRYYGLRIFSLGLLNMKSDTVRTAVVPILLELVKNDPSSLVRAKAIDLLAGFQNKEYRNLFITNVNDSSYSVAGAALSALATLDTSAAFNEAKRQMKQPSKARLTEAIITVLMDYGSEDQFDFIADKYVTLPFVIPIKTISSVHFTRYLAKVANTENFKKGIDLIVHFRDELSAIVSSKINPELNALMLKKEAAGLKEQADYIKASLK